MSITGARITSNGGPGGNCTWAVSASITIVNLTSSYETVVDISPGGGVDWSDANNSGVATLQGPGPVWAPSGLGHEPFLSSVDGTVDPTFTIPCSATSGVLEIDVGIYNGVYPSVTGYTTLSGDAPFLQNGTPLPVIAGAGGAVAFVGAVGGVLLVRLRRRRTTPAR